MQTPLQITFRNFPRSDALEARVRDKAAKLEEFHPRIMSCRVTVEEMRKHHHQGRHFQVSLDLRVPGTWQRVDALLARNRPGQTPLRLDLLRDGAAGMLDLNGAQAVRIDADLVGALKAQPGVRAVKLSLSKPWAS